MTVYERIKKLCEKHNTTITNLCLDITGSRGNLDTWKKGNVRNDYLVKISERFNVTADYLLGRTEKAALDELPLSAEQQEVVDDLVTLPADDFEKVAEYVALLRSKRTP